ncbi:hypothetical protein DWY25_04640 [Holdemania filiformis]|uniref:Uncharacterized protein n=1 Tax=Holdemania filiformis TaxID=61171 RepID=A0A412G4E5_9FIRM|nr:hypothetical protein [Holdemania filiformis]RGR75528.1 hypothetical protein DWY25_04640 [Holdemania filiformis]
MAIKYLDNDGLLYLWGLIKAQVSNAAATKVDKESGKVLSSNDYTDDEKSKLGNVAAGAQVNKIETIKVNGVVQDIKTKEVDITVPTDNASLANGAGYQKAAEVQAAINEALSGITGIDFQIVSALPATGVKGTIYLMAHSHGTGDSYDEYIWLPTSSKFEKIGNTDIDLSGYLKKTDMVAITNAEIDTITA